MVSLSQEKHILIETTMDMMTMKKTLGFAAFFIAIGMLLMMITHNRLIGIIFVALLLFVGYECFST